MTITSKLQNLALHFAKDCECKTLVCKNCTVGTFCSSPTGNTLLRGANDCLGPFGLDKGRQLSLLPQDALCLHPQEHTATLHHALSMCTVGCFARQNLAEHTRARARARARFLDYMSHGQKSIVVSARRRRRRRLPVSSSTLLLKRAELY